MKVISKHLRNTISYLIVITFFNFVLSCDILKEEKEFHYSIPIDLENRTDQNMVVIIFPIVTSSGEALETTNIEQVKLGKKSSQFVTYYLGEKINFENLIICIITWQMISNLDFDVFEKKPYLVRTFYNPKFEIGPEKYGIFAHLIIE